MRFILLSIIAFFSGAAFAANPKPSVNPEKLTGYRLAFRDEFNGDKLNTNVWYYRKGVRLESTQLPENVSVADGNLRLELKKQKTDKSDYTAGGIISRKRFGYGYYEARFKVPATAGWHTSFWLYWYSEDPSEQPQGSKQEIDICENDSRSLTRFSTNLHIWKPAHKNLGAAGVKTPDLSADYHIYGCEVTPKQIRFFFDGKLTGTRDISGIKFEEMNIWLTSVAMGRVENSKLPVYALYDWVRYYKKTGGYPDDITGAPSKQH